jgi:alpha-N-acetylglucosamine transferase
MYLVAYQLKKYGTNADVVCMVTSDVEMKDLKSYFDVIKVVPYLSMETGGYVNTDKRAKFLTDRYASWMNVSFTKWNCLNLTEYNKVCFIDADTLPVADALFDLDCPAAMYRMITTHMA